MANRHTIPDLARDLKPFTNTSGTLRAVANPTNEAVKIYRHTLNADESTRLWLDFVESGIQYIVLSYNTPLLWVTNSGWTYRTDRELTQTSQMHLGLLFDLPAGFDKQHVAEKLDRGR